MLRSVIKPTSTPTPVLILNILLKCARKLRIPEYRITQLVKLFSRSYRTLYGKNDFMSKEELDAHFAAKKAENPAPVVVKKVAKGTGFVDSESSDEDEPKAKKSKK